METVTPTVLTVRQLNTYVKSLLEGNPRLACCAIMGEISNFKRHAQSGHCYFTLKDDAACVKAVMFRGSAIRCPYELCDGMCVICCGRVSLYERDGSYQFYVETCEPAGKGNEALALERLKQKLAAEGLFDAARKRPLPAFPQRIAVVTSDSGAALQDILKIARRRDPLCEIVVAGVSVQGEHSVSDMLAMLERLSAQPGIDLLIIGRGGGSNEDLSAFNDENLARRVAAFGVPVISAVGHQTDLSICDLVADCRAATPSEAAELALPDLGKHLLDATALLHRIGAVLNQRLALGATQLKAVENRRAFAHAGAFYEEKGVSVDHAGERIARAMDRALQNALDQLSHCAVRLDAISPFKVLGRGYSLAQKEGVTVFDSRQVAVGDELSLRLHHGVLHCTVTNKEDGA